MANRRAADLHAGEKSLSNVILAEESAAECTENDGIAVDVTAANRSNFDTS